MPVECSVEVMPIGQEQFHALDSVVMGHVFDIHNTLGRFCGEQIYQEELAQRCRASGFKVHQEVLLRAFHQGFNKPYYLDVLVGGGVIYELKAADTLHGNHQKQLINYLKSYEMHIARLLKHTRLERIHWINLDQRVVTLKTLRK